MNWFLTILTFKILAVHKLLFRHKIYGYCRISKELSVFIKVDKLFVIIFILIFKKMIRKKLTKLTKIAFLKNRNKSSNYFEH